MVTKRAQDDAIVVGSLTMEAIFATPPPSLIFTPAPAKMVFTAAEQTKIICWDKFQNCSLAHSVSLTDLAYAVRASVRACVRACVRA